MKKNTVGIPILFFILMLAGLGNAFAQTFDISSGGAPTIIGALGGSVVGSASVTTNLSVTINFGEVSPANANNIVKVVVPVAVRSTQPYRVTASIVGGTNANPQALQRSDIGFGVNNMRRMGFLSRTCATPHIFYPPFGNDPATGVTILPSGRAAYPSTLNNIGASTVILSGPPLSLLTAGRLTVNGYIFDAIFTITPQFYAATGTTNATLTLTISAGPNVPC